MITERLRPHPHRGDLIAAGAVPLALAAVVIELRMRQWSLGPRFLVVALTAGLLLTMAWLAPLESTTPRAYHSVLMIAGLLVLAIGLVLLAEILGAHRPPGSGALAWTFAAEAAIAIAAARRSNSAACTLLAALAAAIAFEATIAWVFHPHGAGTFRVMLLLLSLTYVASAVRLRDRRRRHAVQFANAAAVLTLVLALSFAVTTLISATMARFGAASGVVVHATPFGWKLYILAVGFGLIAYAAADHEPGPAYFGIAVLLSFVLLAGIPVIDRGSLVGWPLFLLVVAAAGLALGLRPRQPLPPEPGTARDTAPGPATVPMQERLVPPTPRRGVDDGQ